MLLNILLNFGRIRDGLYCLNRVQAVFDRDQLVLQRLGRDLYAVLLGSFIAPPLPPALGSPSGIRPKSFRSKSRPRRLSAFASISPIATQRAASATTAFGLILHAVRTWSTDTVPSNIW